MKFYKELRSTEVVKIMIELCLTPDKYVCPV